MYGFGRGAAASDRDADQGDLCAATRMTRRWQRPNLKCVFLLAHIYARHGMLTHGLLTLSAIAAQPFPSFQ
jgi:hypothetical protein